MTELPIVAATEDAQARLKIRAVSMPVQFFSALQQSARDTEVGFDIDNVRDAGYYAGIALFDWFARWLKLRGEPAPHAISHRRFVLMVSEFFTETGWGTIKITAISEAVMAVDVDSWSEKESVSEGCPVSTGIFSGFFGELAGAPISVLEVECPDARVGRARFLLGSVDVLAYVFEAMSRGIPYDRAATSA